MPQAARTHMPCWEQGRANNAAAHLGSGSESSANRMSGGGRTQLATSLQTVMVMC